MPFAECDVAYAAGLVDGEGSISASRSSHCQKNIRVCVSVTMCDREGPEFMAEVFGGRVTVQKRKTKSGKFVYSWTLHCRKAAAALARMLPYLRIKRQRAEDAIQLASMMRARGTAKMAVFSPAEIELRNDLRHKIKSANIASNGRLQCHSKAVEASA